MATSVVSNNKLTFAAAGKPNDIAGKVEILGLAGVLRAVASGTIEIYDDAANVLTASIARSTRPVTSACL